MREREEKKPQIFRTFVREADGSKRISEEFRIISKVIWFVLSQFFKIQKFRQNFLNSVRILKELFNLSFFYFFEVDDLDFFFISQLMKSSFYALFIWENFFGRGDFCLSFLSNKKNQMAAEFYFIGILKKLNIFVGMILWLKTVLKQTFTFVHEKNV